MLPLVSLVVLCLWLGPFGFVAWIFLVGLAATVFAEG